MQFVAPYSLISAGDLALRLHPDHLADLRASGLSDDTIRAAGVHSLVPSLISNFFYRGYVPSEITSALSFPYQGGAFARIKLFPPGPYASQPKLGKMKYAQPPKTSARIYIPLPVGSGSLIVCEGEKKTLAAVQAGSNAVGIGGVWNWLSQGEPVTHLNLIEWVDRDVTIIPDSDVFQRVDLLRAIYALGRELRALGANVSVAQIPQLGAAKVGLDDYLVAGGAVEQLEVFSLGHRIFKSAAFWHSRWKFQKALEAA
jgi:putative DNA primase/helicase